MDEIMLLCWLFVVGWGSTATATTFSGKQHVVGHKAEEDGQDHNDIHTTPWYRPVKKYGEVLR
jgi:hypothetical protein